MESPRVLISDWPSLLAIFAVIVGGIHWLRSRPALRGFFRIAPPILWVYFVPMVGTSLGIFPKSSPFYDEAIRLLLPPGLVLLLLSSDARSLVKLGPKALGTMLFGTAGVVIGGPLALLLFRAWLPPDTWMGMGALSGSWIGGSSNMVAIKESLGTPEDIFGVMIVVDVLIGYGWMGVVMALSGYQDSIDRFFKVDRTIVDDLNRRVADYRTSQRRPTEFNDLAIIFAIGMGAGWICTWLGAWLPPIGSIISAFGWTVILASTIGIGLSFTPAERLEGAGASLVGNLLLYMLLTTLGAQADMRAVFGAPLFFLVGIVWIAFHAAILFLGGRLLNAPMFLIATASQANIGGVVSAPIVASVYQPSLAPVGLLLGVLGNILGLYAGLLCATLLHWVA
jgi:uncharacterized membrane protein